MWKMFILELIKYSICGVNEYSGGQDSDEEASYMFKSRSGYNFENIINSAMSIFLPKYWNFKPNLICDKS